MIDDNCTATGVFMKFYPEGEDRDRLLGILRIGVAFSENQVGKRIGFFHRHLESVVAKMSGDITFERVVDRLEGSIGEPESPIEAINRRFSFVVYRDPKRGKKEIVFGTLRNLLTSCKNI